MKTPQACITIVGQVCVGSYRIYNLFLSYHYLRFNTIKELKEQIDFSTSAVIINKREYHHRTVSDGGAPFLSKDKNSAFSLCINALPNPYCPYTEKPTQTASFPVLNPDSYTFGNGGKDKIVREGPFYRPETLFARMGVAFAELIVLTFVVLAQVGQTFPAFPFCVCILSPLLDSRLFLRRDSANSLGPLPIFSTAVAVEDPVDHAVVILRFFSAVSRGGWLQGRTQPKLANSSGHLNRLDYIRRQGRKTVQPQAYDVKSLFFDIATQAFDGFSLKMPFPLA